MSEVTLITAGAAETLSRTRSLAETAYDTIEQMIVSRRLAPGAMVSENEIAAELSLGRTPIREALARLKAIGFVEVHPRRGVLVTPVDVIRHLELLEVRRPLDETVARCAIRRAGDGELKVLRGLAVDLVAVAEDRDRDRYFRAKRMLHEAQTRAAHNGTLTATMASLHAQSRRSGTAMSRATVSVRAPATMSRSWRGSPGVTNPVQWAPSSGSSASLMR